MSALLNYQNLSLVRIIRNLLHDAFSYIQIVVLQLFLSSPKPVLKFAATRTLAALALIHPASVSTCNVDLESLIADPNRSVATYAITTLLKVCLFSFIVSCLMTSLRLAMKPLLIV